MDLYLMERKFQDIAVLFRRQEEMIELKSTVVLDPEPHADYTAVPRNSNPINIPRSSSFEHIEDADDIHKLTQTIHNYTITKHRPAGSVSSIEPAPIIPTSLLNDLVPKLAKLSEKTYKLTSSQFVSVADSFNNTPSPPTETLFPYLHGDISTNQQDFFGKEHIQTLPAIRYLLIIRATDLPCGTCLKSSLKPSEILKVKPSIRFDVCEPQTYTGFNNKLYNAQSEHINLRNFANVVQLLAPVSDIIIYNESNDYDSNLNLAKQVASFQSPDYNCFVLDYNAEDIRSDLIIEDETADSGDITNWNNNYLLHERVETWLITSSRELFKNVWLGNILDFNNKQSDFQIIIHCSETAKFPSSSTLEKLLMNKLPSEPVYLEFPASGSYALQGLVYEDVLSFLNVCKLIYYYSNSKIFNNKYKILIYSFDGYTHLSLLALGYEMFRKRTSLESAIMNYHLIYNKNLFFFKIDYEMLKFMEKFFNYKSPKRFNRFNNRLVHNLNFGEINNWYSNDINKPKPDFMAPDDESDWFHSNMDNNLPSKILPNVYLSCHKQASSITLLNTLKINKIISIGEKPTWLEKYVNFSELKLNKITMDEEDGDCNGIVIYEIFRPLIKKLPHLEKLIYIEGLQDDGRDSILPLLVNSKYNWVLNHDANKMNLVHCKIGVSRSASLCIASVMVQLKISLVRAYIYVRVRRLNIIIQPNLRIFYDLLKFEEFLSENGQLESHSGLREIDWHIICKEVDKLNSYYLT